MKVCVMGAGEAGRAAAREAALDGASVTLVDALDRPLPDWRSLPSLANPGWKEVPPFRMPGGGAEVLFATRVVAARPGSALTADGRELRADSFVVATGCEFERVSAEGTRKAGVFVLDRPGAYAELGRAMGSARRVVVAGEGWRGMEVAEALAEKGRSVVLLVSSWQSRAPGGLATSALLRAAAERGVTVFRGASPKAVGSGRVEAVLCEGLVYPADALVLVPKRLPRPVRGLAEGSLPGGVPVGLDMRTGSPGLLAAGGCAATREGFPPGSNLAFEQSTSGRVAGANAAGKNVRISQTRRFQVSVFGLRWTSLGMQKGTSASVEGKRGERNTCWMAYDRRSGTVTGIELVEEAAGQGSSLPWTAKGPTFEYLAYDGSADSSDISLVSETARLGLRAWSGS